MNDLILLHNFTREEKLKVHQLGLKHFSFSVFLFTSDNFLLLQQRSNDKYHSKNLWSNSCCSHFTDENNIDDQQFIKMRIQNEIGIYLKNDLTRIKILEYNVQIDDLIENEIDYIYLGIIDRKVSLCVNKSEVNYLKFMTLNQINFDIKKHSEQYTKWFKLFMNDEELIQAMLDNLCDNE